MRGMKTGITSLILFLLFSVSTKTTVLATITNDKTMIPSSPKLSMISSSSLVRRLLLAAQRSSSSTRTIFSSCCNSRSFHHQQHTNVPLVAFITSSKGCIIPSSSRIIHNLNGSSSSTGSTIRSYYYDSTTTSRTSPLNAYQRKSQQQQDDSHTQSRKKKNNSNKKKLHTISSSSTSSTTTATKRKSTSSSSSSSSSSEGRIFSTYSSSLNTKSNHSSNSNKNKKKNNERNTTTTSKNSRNKRNNTTSNYKPKGTTKRMTNQQQQPQQPPRRRKGGDNEKLPIPQIVFSNNHLLLLNKPPGYFCQPNESQEQIHSSTGQEQDPKCLLTKCKTTLSLGGGSQKNFLLPMHRLDQPCTGIVCLAKTSKAGTRIGNAFRKHHVVKEYYVVVEGNLDLMKKKSNVDSSSSSDVYTLSGVFQQVKNKDSRSVRYHPLNNNNNPKGRVCHLQWEHILSTSQHTYNLRQQQQQHHHHDDNCLHLLSVKTGTGAKHQVRAMMSQIAGAPLCGDLRYNANSALPDRSVALHARSLALPTVKLGDMDLQHMTFVADIPLSWADFFSIRERDLKQRGGR